MGHGNSGMESNDHLDPSDSAAEIQRRQLRRWMMLAAQIALVLLILVLLAAIWLPAIIGPHPETH